MRKRIASTELQITRNMLKNPWKVTGRLLNNESMYQVKLTNVGDFDYRSMPLYTN